MGKCTLESVVAVVKPKTSAVFNNIVVILEV